MFWPPNKHQGSLLSWEHFSSPSAVIFLTPSESSLFTRFFTLASPDYRDNLATLGKALLFLLFFLVDTNKGDIDCFFLLLLMTPPTDDPATFQQLPGSILKGEFSSQHSPARGNRHGKVSERHTLPPLQQQQHQHQHHNHNTREFLPAKVFLHQKDKKKLRHYRSRKTRRSVAIRGKQTNE